MAKQRKKNIKEMWRCAPKAAFSDVEAFKIPFIDIGT